VNRCQGNEEDVILSAFEPLLGVVRPRRYRWLLVLAGWVWLSVFTKGAERFPARVYTRDLAPSIQDRPELPRVRSISQYGITWTFESPVLAGRFVNGDWYVVGPVRVVSIDPKPLLGTEVPAGEISERERKRGAEREVHPERLHAEFASPAGSGLR